MKQNEDQSHITPQQRTRRNFVKKTLAGSALLSLPIKNVWATGTVNLNSSAAASGNGSGGAGLQQREWHLEGPNYWKHNLPSDLWHASFVRIFDGEAYFGKQSDTYPIEIDGRKKFDEKIIDILRVEKEEYAGCNDYNRILIALYLNARESSDSSYSNIYYPVLDGSHYSSARDFAKSIYSNSKGSQYFSALEYASFIANPNS
ncbi:hypothetical protein D210916BOD24_21840 [Alteromonas sp. D210916BOD_24]|uniref:hypothetical protein n=1 Tax=Alteromonas sp. D210916BOD_24 TaxID=3157618 RepID=UPI00399C8C7E